ncbi:MAG TPA: hypothetical protein VN924_26220 [Bryobacteraceae bacterium]|nr:hypothetical protein [Bryobacteraceae bacterium]
MKHYIAFIILLCGALSSGAFGQSTPANAIVGLGYLYSPVTVAPGQLITVFVAGSLQGGISAAVSGIPAPVLQVRPASGCPAAALCSSLTAITIQIPYDIEPACYFVGPVCDLVVALAQLVVTANGVAGAPIPLAPQADRIHILTACDTLAPGGSGSGPYNGLPCAPLVTHADGSLVTVGRPAQASEEVVIYAVGLGLTTPSVPTGQPASTAAPTDETFNLDFNFRPNALATQPIQPSGLLQPILPRPVYAGLTPGFVGLYQINFVVAPPPVGTQACSGAVQSNLTVSVGGMASFDGAGICVAPTE